MESLGNAIANLYRHFILRDVLSSITPGAIIAWVMLYRFFPQLLDQNIHWLLYIPIFGVLYVMGFAVECLERLFGMRLHKLDDSSFRQRLRLFCGALKDKSDINEKWRGQAINFLRLSSDHDWAGQNYERLVVLKQMCANNFGALVIAVVLFFFSFFPWIKFGILSVVMLALLISLYWGYRDYTIAATTMEEKFSSRR